MWVKPKSSKEYKPQGHSLKAICLWLLKGYLSMAESKGPQIGNIGASNADFAAPYRPLVGQ